MLKRLRMLFAATAIVSTTQKNKITKCFSSKSFGSLAQKPKIAVPC